MRFGYWMPVFGGWLRNVEDEGMPVAWPYLRDLAVDSERHGFDLSLVAELNLNDIKGHRAPAADAWTLGAALAAVTQRLELMLAVRPNYHAPSLTAKALSTLDLIAPGRISLNVVSSWWADEATQYGMPFDVHDARYQRTEEWLTVLRRLLTEPTVDHHGALYDLRGRDPRAQAEQGRRRLHGRRVAAGAGRDRRPRRRVRDARRPARGHRRPGPADLRAPAAAGRPPLRFGVSGYVIVRDTEAEAQAELDRVLDVRSSPEAYASYQDFVQRLPAGGGAVPAGVQRVQPGAAGRAGRHAGEVAERIARTRRPGSG